MTATHAWRKKLKHKIYLHTKIEFTMKLKLMKTASIEVSCSLYNLDVSLILEHAECGPNNGNCYYLVRDAQSNYYKSGGILTNP